MTDLRFLGTCWIGVTNAEYEQPIRELVEIPQNPVVLCAASVGYPAENPSSHRRPPRATVHRERYGTKKK